jgi:hypothetical protein
MATIHTGTTMVPTKLELLSDWLPRQPWYVATGGPPQLSRAGGFRLDDPAGEVGIEFMVVTDAAGGGETAYLVPMTYRAGPLAGAEAGLIGTSEHGVLGTRWIYDGVHDPVAVTQLLEFICGRVEAQQQSRSDTRDPSVGRRWAPHGRLTVAGSLGVTNGEPARTSVAVESTDPAVAHVLDLVRVLEPSDGAADAALGRVDADWTTLHGATARGPVAVVR